MNLIGGSNRKRKFRLRRLPEAVKNSANEERGVRAMAAIGTERQEVMQVYRTNRIHQLWTPMRPLMDEGELIFYWRAKIHRDQEFERGN